MQTEATPGEDWARWRAAFSEASFHWQIEAMQALCEAPAFRKRFAEKLEPYRQFIDYFLDRRWVETRDIFEDLAKDTGTPGRTPGVPLLRLRTN